MRVNSDFLAFVDEAGSEGDPSKLGGFEFLILSAAVVRRRSVQSFTEVWERLRQIERKPTSWRWRGFKECNSDSTKYLAACLIGELPFKFASVIVHKPSLKRLDHQASHGDLYFFASQLLLERISWIVRDGHSKSPEKYPVCRIVFSERRNTSYDKFVGYSRQIKAGGSKYPSSAAWDHIDFNQIVKVPHHTCGPLAVADFIAAATLSAVENQNKKYGLSDDRFLLPISRNCYKPDGRAAWANGLKLYPNDVGDLTAEDRFRWLRSHYMKK